MPWDMGPAYIDPPKRSPYERTVWGFRICVLIVCTGVWAFFAIKLYDANVQIQHEKARVVPTLLEWK
jgi:hypothetical protein